MSSYDTLDTLPPEFESIILGYSVVSTILAVIFIIATGIIAYKKGRSVFGFVLLTLFFGLLGLIIVACVPNRNKPTSYTPPASSSHSSSSSTPTVTFGRGSTSSSRPSSSSSSSSGNQFSGALGGGGGSSKKGFGIKMCPHCGSAISSSHCAMCGKDNNLF